MKSKIKSKVQFTELEAYISYSKKKLYRISTLSKLIEQLSNFC